MTSRISPLNQRTSNGSTEILAVATSLLPQRPILFESLAWRKKKDGNDVWFAYMTQTSAISDVYKEGE